VSAAIVPRWEWRTFGDDFGDADDRLGALPPERVEESDEVYLLSLASDASVKIRDGLMDVKQLEHVNDDGLEQWRPIMKAAFPLSTADVRAVMAALGVDAAPLARAEYSLDELIDELVVPKAELAAVNVHKRREHYTVGGCMAERSEVRTAEGARRTIAVESEDPALVIAAVRELGLGSRRNVSFPRGLKSLVGFGGRRYAVIDVGTNSVKFHIAELGADGEWHPIVDRADVTRLGEGLNETGRLGEKPIERTVAAIAAMAEEADREGVEAIAAVGTAGLRIAANSADFIAAVREHAGIEVEVIPGEEEGRLAYLAAKSGLGLGEGSLVVFDTGGGSSQFTFGHGDHVDERFSVNVGAARFTERYGLDTAVPDDRLAAALDAIAADLERLDGRPAPDTLVGMGGAITNITAVKHGLATYDPSVVHGSVLDRGEIDRQIELYRTRTSEQRREIVGLQPKRGEVILAGACIVRTVLAKLGRESLIVSDRGLRHGLIVDRFGRAAVYDAPGDGDAKGSGGRAPVS
jgi:exopolyphosphatase / guanosine-5'-triphosphate,3'-diphosphate pyrophosphatase